ncbi:MAG: sporulation protein YunB [Ruminococcus sp.]|nr:sporulation protein YunB [Ruminococcus sp.]
MRYKSRRRFSGRVKLWAIIFVIITALFTAVLIKTEKNVRPIAAQQAEYYSKLTANKIISSAVSDYLDENRYTYSDFAAVLYDENGNAAAIEAVTYNINRVQSELSLIINSEFMESGDTSAEIPIGSLTNSYLLAGIGPHLRLRICPAREAQVELTSTFSSAGVNQTCHRISATVTAYINSSLPLYSFSTEVSFEFLIAENIIVGEVPEASLNFLES